MGHISRTHRVTMDWLFDRQNLDAGIQIKHVHTSKQIADILTEARSRVEGGHSWRTWSQLTHLVNLMTPHMHTNSHLPALFSFVQKSDKMSQRLASVMSLCVVQMCIYIYIYFFLKRQNEKSYKTSKSRVHIIIKYNYSNITI